MSPKADISVSATVTRGAESWQFFAFVFAALVGLAFGLVDELQWARWQRAALKLLCFGAIGHVTLVSTWRRESLARVLGIFKDFEGRAR